MAKLVLSGGFFLFESIISGCTLAQGSADSGAASLVLTALGAAPLACQLARSIFYGEIDAQTDAEPA